MAFGTPKQTVSDVEFGSAVEIDAEIVDHDYGASGDGMHFG